MLHCPSRLVKQVPQNPCNQHTTHHWYHEAIDLIIPIKQFRMFLKSASGICLYPRNVHDALKVAIRHATHIPPNQLQSEFQPWKYRQLEMIRIFASANCANASHSYHRDLLLVPEIAQDVLESLVTSSPHYRACPENWHADPLFTSQAIVPLVGGIVDHLVVPFTDNPSRTEIVGRSIGLADGISVSVFYTEVDSESNLPRKPSISPFVYQPAKQNPTPLIVDGRKTVGRWPSGFKSQSYQSFKQDNDEQSDWIKSIFEKYDSFPLDKVSHEAPEFISRIEKNIGSNDSACFSLINGTNHDTNSSLLNLLNQNFPRSHKFGVTCSSLIFRDEFFNETTSATGIPYVLFYGDESLSGNNESVGYAQICRKRSQNFGNVDIEEVSDKFTITRCQGNIILELNGENPAKLLLRFIGSNEPTRPEDIPKFETGGAKSKANKEDQFFMLLHHPECESKSKGVPVPKLLLSGDPAKGHIAVDVGRRMASSAGGRYPFKEGQVVQFARRKRLGNSSSEKDPIFVPHPLEGTSSLIFGNLNHSLPFRNEKQGWGLSADVSGVSSNLGFVLSNAEGTVGEIEDTPGSVAWRSLS